VPTQKNSQVLIVDDEPDLREMLARMLAAKGYDASTAADGLDGLNKMKSSVPGVVISDLNMPRMSGFEFLSVVRQEFPQVLVIAMSGAYAPDELMPPGVIADAFYPKAVNSPNTLAKMIEELTQQSASGYVFQKRQALQP
jgi:CheY-like chemotaxis protein